MSTVEHSPGPWTRQGSIIQDGEGKLIAAAEFADVTVEVANTNAQLIVTAPQLLEALNMLFGKNGGMTDPLVHSFALDAIARATGK